MNNGRKIYLDIYGQGGEQELNLFFLRCKETRGTGTACSVTVFCNLLFGFDEIGVTEK